jgi:hypothetical protein
MALVHDVAFSICEQSSVGRKEEEARKWKNTFVPMRVKVEKGEKYCPAISKAT